MLVHIKEIIKKANKENYAIGAFNVHNLETALGISRAAIKMKSPVIMQFSEGAIKYIGLKEAVAMITTIAEEEARAIPIVLHLDHGSSFESVAECINAGFSSVQIDASNQSYIDNVNITKSVVVFARKNGVWVQGEVGAMIGGHGKLGGKIKNLSVVNPMEVISYVRETKVDTIAATIGTAHGSFSNEDINFDVLKKITSVLKIPFVLHGGSGINDNKIKKAIKLGVRIINVGTDIKIAFSKTLILNCLKNKKETDPRNLLRPSVEAVEKIVMEKIKLFGSYYKI